MSDKADLIDPLLLELSLRENLDPEGLHSDSELWDALEKSHVCSALPSYSAYSLWPDSIAQESCRYPTGEIGRADVG